MQQRRGGSAGWRAARRSRPTRCAAPRLQAGGRAPPTWFFAGGSALKYWAAGLLQKLFGAPTDGMMLREFGLGGAPPPPK